MSEQQKSAPKRASSKKESEVTPSDSSVTTPSPVVIDDDRISPIVSFSPGPRMGLSVYLAGNDVSFSWLDARTGESSSLPHPLAVRVKSETDEYYRLELFFPDSKDAELATSRFDNKVFVLKNGVNPDTGRPRGRRFENLVGTGWARDRLPQLDPELRYLKYVLHTNQVNHFDEQPRSLKGLGPPIPSGASSQKPAR